MEYIIYTAISVAVIVFLAGAFFFSLGFSVFYITTMRRKKREKSTIDEIFEGQPEVVSRLLSYDNKFFDIKTTHSKVIKARLFLCGEDANGTVILVHGIYDNMYVLSKYALEYLHRGYNVMMYNQRSVAGSSGRCKTFGYYEKYDLQGVAKFVHVDYGNKPIIVHGFSMGAATAALQSELNETDKYVGIYILDSPFSSMKEILLHMTRNVKSKKSGKIKKLPVKMLLALGNFINMVFLRFSYKKVMPKSAVSSCHRPMFIIHAKGDKICPVSMGEEIFDCKINGVRSIWTPEDSAHVNIYNDYPDRYFEKIISFLESNI